MINHKVEYKPWLSAFLTNAQMTLNSMREEVWAEIHALAEYEGVTFDACLYLMLQVLSLLPQIPVNISFQAPMPLTLAYCPESTVYRKWYPEQGGISLLPKEVRVAHTLSKALGSIYPAAKQRCKMLHLPRWL